MRQTYCMFGWSRSSPNTNTAGESKACLMSPTAAAPLVPLARSTKASFCPEESDEEADDDDADG